MLSKMAASVPPTASELAYLAELETRLRELRQRQADFMAQTAQMLSRMSCTAVGEAFLGPPKANSTASSGHVNIKKLIQRFEDLRKIATSQQLSNLHELPEELMNVDVQRLLKGYEKLIEEGNLLQQSWFRLKQSKDGAADLMECEKELSIGSKESAKESSDAASRGSNDSALEVFFDSASNGSNDAALDVSHDAVSKVSFDTASKVSKASKMSHDSASKMSKGSASKVSINDSSSKLSNDLALKVSSDSSSKVSHDAASKGSNDSSSKLSINDSKTDSKTDSYPDSEQLLNFSVVNTERNCSKQKYGRARWGALMQLMLRLSPFNTCSKRGKHRKPSSSSSSAIMPTKKIP